MNRNAVTSPEGQKTVGAETVNNKDTLPTLGKVLDRADDMDLIGAHYSRITAAMDLDSAVQSCGLDLAKLLKAGDFDFTHDVCGIARHMDRNSYPGKLTGGFLPRCASGTASR